MTTTRQQVICEVADRILAMPVEHPMRVGIDGHSAAGKTTLADELANTLRDKTSRPVLRVTASTTSNGMSTCERNIRPARRRAITTRCSTSTPSATNCCRRSVRAATAATVPRSWTSAAVHPSTAASRWPRTTRSSWRTAGSCRSRPVTHWDLRVYLHIEMADVLRRGTIRDQAWMDSAEAAAERYRTYYIPGEMLYLAEIHPADRADIVIDNRTFEEPWIPRTRLPAKAGPEA